jgi:AraC-like DNA-binding protein
MNAAGAPEADWARHYSHAFASSGLTLDIVHARFIQHRFTRHFHDYFVIGLVESGVQQYFCDGKRHQTPAGSVFFVNPGETHTGEPATPDGYVYRTLNIPARMLDDASVEIDGDGVSVSGRGSGGTIFRRAVVRDGALTQALRQLHGVIAGDGGPLEIEQALYPVLAQLAGLAHGASRAVAREPDSMPAATAGAVRRAAELLEARFDEAVSLRDLAQASGLSPFHLARLFHRRMGLPPHQYHENVRMQRARDLLMRESIADVAVAVGYPDQSHFTRRFKRFYGVTPGLYVRSRKIAQDAGRRRAG